LDLHALSVCDAVSTKADFCCMRAYKLALPAAYMLLKQQRQHEETRSLYFWKMFNGSQ
jgi:hypothetical protein